MTKLEDIKIRSKYYWYNDGEKYSKFLLYLEKNKSFKRKYV